MAATGYMGPLQKNLLQQLLPAPQGLGLGLSHRGYSMATARAPPPPPTPSAKPPPSPGSSGAAAAPKPGRFAWAGWLIPLVGLPASLWYFMEAQYDIAAQTKGFESSIKPMVAKMRARINDKLRGEGGPEPPALPPPLSASSPHTSETPAVPTKATSLCPPPNPVPPAPAPASPPAVQAAQAAEAPVPKVEKLAERVDSLATSEAEAKAAASEMLAEKLTEAAEKLTVAAEKFAVSRHHYAPVLSHAHEPSIPPVEKGTMGINQDLTPGGLLQHIQDIGKGDGENAAGFRSRHDQAVADAELMARAIEQAQEHFTNELNKAKEESLGSARKLVQAVRSSSQAAKEWKALMQQHKTLEQEAREIEVKQAEKRVLMRTAELWMQERQMRAAQIGVIKQQVDALAQAHDARAQYQATTLRASMLTQGIIGLTMAMETGSPLSPHVACMAKGSGGDELIEAALGSFSHEAIHAGVPTNGQLQEQFRLLRSNMATTSYLPEGKGGILSHMLGHLAARLKADESTASRILGGGRGVGDALSRAEQCIANGQLAVATDLVANAVEGTAAAATAKTWLQGARARAAAEATVEVLRAHATSLASAL